MSRRQFLKTAVVLSATVAGTPYVRASDKSGSRPPIIGERGRAYECLHDWGQLPNGLVYGVTHGVVQDASGLIYVKHRPHATSRLRDAIVVFDHSGKFVRSWGSDYQRGAHGLHLAVENGREYLYLCDTALRQVIKTTLEGEVIWAQGCPLESGLYESIEGYKPANVATAPDGTVYVADGYGSDYIHVYRPDGTYVRSFGGTGESDGKFRHPHGIAVDRRGSPPRLLVADRSNHRLVYLSLQGETLSYVTDELRLPCHFHERNGELLVPDLMSRVTLFDRDDRLIAHLGDGGTYQSLREQPRSAFTPGKFVAPHSAIFDREGDIFVVEWVEVGRVTKLRRVA